MGLHTCPKSVLHVCISMQHTECIILTLDISLYNITSYCTQHNFQGKTSVRLRTHERHRYPTLTYELWVSFVSYLEKSDYNISGVLHGVGVH